MKRMLGFRKMSVLSATLAIFAVILALSGSTPAFSDDQSGLITIESDDSLVEQTGTWTSQNATGASGGSYLYSSGDENDSLSLDFFGTTIEVIYVGHPTFGSFAIEIDNNIVRTVETASSETSFDQRAVVDYLDNENHTVRIFPVEGVIAIDAFITQLPPEREEVGSPEVLECNPDQFPIRASIVDGVPPDPNSPSTQVSLSGDGRYVAFASTASNLIGAGQDTNTASDVFVFDRLLCVMTRVSVSSAGVQATGGGSTNPSISQDGRYVAFESAATNLLGAGVDTNGLTDIFVHDRQTGTTTRVSVTTTGTQATGGNSTNPDISSDGQRVVFQSDATNLLGAGVDTNSATDIFMRNLATNTTTRVSLTAGGLQANGASTNPAISGNGQFVAFESAATDLVAGDTNARADIFVRDLTGNTTTRVSLTSTGTQITDGGGSNLPDISNDGRYVVFETDSENIVPGIVLEFSYIYVRDRTLNTTTRVSLNASGGEGGDASNAASISGNGRFVAFHSGGTNFVSPDTAGTIDVFVKDLTTGAIARASLKGDGSEPDDDEAVSIVASLSDSGRNVAFSTNADLTSDFTDNNFDFDIYVADIPFNTAPSDLLATATSNSEIALHWNDNASNEVNYRLERSFSPTTGFSEFASPGANFRDWTDVDLECETTYYYRVRAALPGSTFSEYSNVSSARTLLCAMSPPSNFTITAVGIENMDMSWTDESSTETEFRIYRSLEDPPEDPPFDLQVGTVDANAVTFHDIGLSCNGIEYAYYVTAYRADDGFETEASNIDSAVTPTCPDPGVTTPLTPTGQSAISRPTFRFTEAYRTSWYRIEVKNSANANVINNWYELNKPGGVQCSGGQCWVSPGINLPNGPYTWRIETYYQQLPPPDPAPYSYLLSTSIGFTVVPPQPIAPKYPDPSHLVTTFSDVEFSWDEVPTIPYYRLLVLDPSNKVVHDVWYDSSVCVAAVCSVTLPTPLFYNGWHSWYIRVWSPDGYGPWSAQTFFLVQVPAPTAPIGLAVDTDSFGVPNRFSWTNNPEVSYYQVYVSGPGGVWINKWYAKGDSAMPCDNPGTCSITTTLPFSEGGYDFYVQAWSSSGQQWSNLHEFTVTINDPAIPSGFGMTTVNGLVNGIPQTFSWNDDANTTWFHVYVARDGGGVYLDKWYQKGVSTEMTCTTTCSISPKLLVINGSYKWYVQAYGPGGISDWSGANNFVVGLNLPDIPINLTRSPLTGIPNTFQWANDHQDATHYQLYLNRGSAIYINTWYEKGNSIMTCTTGGGPTCTVVINNLPLVNSATPYTWYVRAYGPAGLSLWSDAASFTIGYAAPNIPNPLTEVLGPDGYPDGYSWPDDPNATYFNVYLRKGSVVWLNQWYQKGVATAMTCGGGICTLNQPIDFSNGLYSWYVRGYGPAGIGLWSAEETFTVAYTIPGIPQNLSVTMTNGMPSLFRWDSANDVQWYRLYVASSTGVKWIDAWHQQSVVCTGGQCTVPTNLPFLAGTYSWYVGAWNPTGVTTWTSVTSPYQFTVSLSSPAAPTLVAPPNDFFDTTGKVIFKWNTVPHATYYSIQIKDATGLVIFDNVWYNATTACVGGLCSVEVTLTGENLVNATWRVRGYGAVFSNPFGLYSASRTITVLD